MSKESNVFNAGDWLGEILNILGTFRQINDFLLNKDAQDAYLKTRQVFTYSKKGKEFCDNEESTRIFHDDIISTISETNNFYKHQIIVLSSTYIELILKDFLIVFFKEFPERMYEFIYDQDRQEYKGSVSLREILKTPNMSELITKLANQATSNLLKGKFSAQLKNLMKITKHNLSDVLEDELNNLNDFRNTIVHENSRKEIDPDKVENSIETCEKLIWVLAKISEDNKIGLDTYIPFH